MVQGDEALRFVLVAGTCKGGTTTLFARLASVPSDYEEMFEGTDGSPAVDIRPVTGSLGMYVVAFPGLKGKDLHKAHLAQSLAKCTTGGGRAGCGTCV